MQFRVKDFDDAIHEKWLALTIPQPEADYICKPVCQRNDGSWAACKTSMELPFKTAYRGDILIVSSGSKYPSVHPSGATIGLVMIDSIERLENGLYLWRFSDPRMVVPFPAKGPRTKLWPYVCPKGEVTEYPRLIRLD